MKYVIILLSLVLIGCEQEPEVIPYWGDEVAPWYYDPAPCRPTFPPASGFPSGVKCK